MNCEAAEHVQHDCHTTPATNHRTGSVLTTVSLATVHCLVGCSIGELAGLIIGVTAGFGVATRVVLATVLAFVSGLALTVIPLVRRERVGIKQALQMVWLGEIVSIGVMEVAMNATDLAAGGVQANSIWSGLFWLGFAASLPAGFVAAWPVNWFMIRRGLKRCH